MERRKKEEAISPINKIHIIYVSIIIFISLSSGIYIFTIKNSYENILIVKNMKMN